MSARDKRYADDASKLWGLGWEEKTSFEEGLKRTLNWYRRFGKMSLGDTDTSSVTRSPLDQIRLDHSAVHTLGGSAAR